MELRWEELEKAHRNLRQIYLYLKVATAGSSPEDASSVELLERIQAVAGSISSRLQEMAQGSGVEIERAPLPSDPPPGQAQLDRAKLQAVAAYMSKMQQWVQGAGEATVTDRGREPLAQVISLLGAIEGLSPAGSAAGPGDRGGIDDDPLASIREAPSGPEAVEVPDVGELELEHTFQEPLLRGVDGKFELTQRAIALIEEFFERAGISYEPGERRRLYRKIARWLETTPDGMVLTLRIGGLSGRAEPYPKYRQRKGSTTS